MILSKKSLREWISLFFIDFFQLRRFFLFQNGYAVDKSIPILLENEGGKGIRFFVDFC
jgi:hypothetical protein